MTSMWCLPFYHHYMSEKNLATFWQAPPGIEPESAALEAAVLTTAPQRR